MKILIKYILLGAVFLCALYIGSVAYQKINSRIYKQENQEKYNMNLNELDSKVATNTLQKIVFAGGCFWCTEAAFNPEYGVESAVSGYFGGQFKDPTYEQVSAHETDHREVVQVYFNTASTSAKKVLVNFWKDIDPTQVGGQFHDVGRQYTTAIYYFTDEQKMLAEESKKVLEDSKKFGDKKIVVEILDGRGLTFYPAEEYHQDYSVKNPVRYEYYKNGSGRTDFIKNNWAGDKTFDQFLKEDDKMSGDKLTNKTDKNIINSDKIAGEKMMKHVWENFTDAMKQARLAQLSDEQVKVTQKAGTERPHTNLYDKNWDKGIYVDIVSGEPLYTSTDKFDSGTGWPSFVKPISLANVVLHTDNYLIYSRTEVKSKIADSHLGHVFDDGPIDRGGKRYCMNSAALKFVPLTEMEAQGYGEYISLIK